MNDFEEDETTADDIWDWAKENADTIVLYMMRSPSYEVYFELIQKVYFQSVGVFPVQPKNGEQ